VYHFSEVEKLLTPAWIRALAGLFINLSAGWFSVVLIGPQISVPTTLSEFWFLTVNIIFGILSLLIAVKLEELLEK